MTDDHSTDATDADVTGARATVRTAHDHPELVAAAVRPDNTDEIDTRTGDGRVVTTVERDDAAGLASTVDDYLVNLEVADSTVRRATDYTTRQ